MKKWIELHFQYFWPLSWWKNLVCILVSQRYNVGQQRVEGKSCSHVPLAKRSHFLFKISFTFMRLQVLLRVTLYFTLEPNHPSLSCICHASSSRTAAATCVRPSSDRQFDRDQTGHKFGRGGRDKKRSLLFQAGIQIGCLFLG